MQTDASVPEDLLISEFLNLVAEMFSRSDYLLPLAAGQRQFRQDNYQMASASQLEDLFFDAFGMFLRENHPDVRLERRKGNEVWDYTFQGLALSHKETLSRGVAVWWTAGQRPSGSGAYVPQPGKEAYSSPCPIVLIHSGNESVDYATSVAGGPRTGRLRGTLGSGTVAGAKSIGSHALVLADQEAPRRLRVDTVYRPSEWARLDFFDLWPTLGGQGLDTRDLWLDHRYADRRIGMAHVSSLARGAVLQLDNDYIPPGVYVLSTGQLSDVPIVANNRAHSIAQSHLDAMLRASLANGRFRPFPLWFAHFASAPPPNLYARQRAQYEALFSARQRRA